FKYKKSLLAAILSATLLAGCDGGGSGSSSDTPPVDSGTGSLPEVKPDPTPNPEPTPEPTPDPEPTPEPIPDPEPTPEPEPEPVPTKTGYLTLGGSQRVTGATCNGESSDGFTFKPGEDVTCVAGNTTIATFNTQSEAARSLSAVEKVSFSLEDAQELAGSDDKKSNAVSLVTSSNSCPANTEQVCLTFSSVIESKRFDSLYKQIDLAPEEFKKLVNEEVENNAATDKAPSTHTSPVVPVTTPGTKPDLNASFVSANAEQFYQYQPTEIILSEGRLVDSQGYGVAGVNYYTNSGRGVTGENGEFSFSWGETISFSIDTFELGSVRGNKSTIALTELGDEVRGANIDQLIHRYSTTGQNNTRVVPDDVRKVFAEYRAELIAESLWEFIDEDRSVQTRLGREDSEYLARSVPFYAANQPLADISEMRVVQGMDAGLYQKLKPLVCALPMTRQQININTLDVTQSVILEALFDPWLSPVQARALLQQRPAKGWEDVDQFLAQPLLADVDERTKKQLKTVLSVDSNYFWLRSDITVNEIELTMNSLIVRMGPQHFSVLWHQTGESE
ncbi:type II secretion system minor pseudopilin GspK, partial [Escherichia coli]|nr:type II secretion system minor pseudopilin GspK [Escherichia coli]